MTSKSYLLASLLKAPGKIETYAGIDTSPATVAGWIFRKLQSLAFCAIASL
uniref:Uncharacterized protein n=1 Tax=Pseudomonas marincola TaxID=437900 RepID=A0A653E0I9_9PSED